MTRTRMKLAATATVITLAGALAIDGGHAMAVAQNSTQAPPPSAAKISGGQVEGDESGAVRALGSADDGVKKGKPMVTVPHLGGEDAERTGGPPPGTR